jgi:GT2 family glycosyltransferase
LVYPLQKKPIQLTEIEVKDRVLELDTISRVENNSQIIFLKSKINFGFAAGNNVCMEYAAKLFNSEYYFLLNNDTVIKSDALSKLIDAMEENINIGAAQSTIYYYDDPHKIANAGGHIFFWGQTRYYREIIPGSTKNISFINGCALCIRSAVVNKIGMLSESFFFGEDDFEYSMRLKENNISKLSVADSHVFHKISLCAPQMYDNPERRVLMFALDRMVDLKSYYSKPIWWLWRYFAMSYFFLLMVIQYKVTFSKSIKTIRILNYYSKRLKDVKKETWDNIMKDKEL